MLSRFLLFLIVAVVVASGDAYVPDTVKTAEGPVMGFRNVTTNIRTFRGIPFAASTAPPNRFKPPQPVTPWTSPFNATTWGDGCVADGHGIDTGKVQSENCLNLNVYVPLNASLAANASLPVYVYFYGGSFHEGDNVGPFDMYDGSYLASTHDVIVVTPNYRLGAFGFLASESSNGNYGIMDQTFALRWVQRNIKAFGGDPAHVVIGGESAGAMSVGIHLVSPMSDGLFVAAVMESNPSGMVYLPNDKAKDIGQSFCSYVGCKHADGTCDDSCLETLTTDEVQKGWKKSVNVLSWLDANWGQPLDGFLSFIPTDDGHVLPGEVITLLKDGKFTKVPTLVGTNTAEAQTFLYGMSDKPVELWLANIVINVVFGDPDGGKVNEYYHKYGFTDGRALLSAVLTDYWFRCASEQFATAQANANMQSYVYRFNHVPSPSWAAALTKFGLPAICAKEVCHMAEIPFVFHVTDVHNTQVNVTMPADEVKLATEMGDYWTNFIKTLDPNGDGLPVWPKWSASARPNMVLQEAFATESSEALCSFWDGIGYNH